MVPGWLITTVWFVGGICATGAFWFFLGSGNTTGIVISGVGSVLCVIVAIGLQIRNERAKEGQHPSQQYPAPAPVLPVVPASAERALPGAPQRPLNADERDFLTGISTEGRDLLLAAAQHPHGEIFFAQSFRGLSVTVGERVFCEPGNSRTEARARRSVQELVELGLVQDRGGNGSIFSVTDEGFGAADLIEKLRKSAV
jgi:hypothetical protein